LESGVEIDRCPPKVKIESIQFSPEPSLPAQEDILSFGKKLKKGKHSNDSSGKEIESQLSRGKLEKQNKWKILRIRELASLFL
jgi:hypothetical protein